MKAYSPLLLLIFLIQSALIGCKEQPPVHPAQGTWNAQMVSNGAVIEIGKLEIGPDSVTLKSSNLSHHNLEVRVERNYVYFSDPNQPKFEAKVRVIGPATASMEMAGLSGFLELSKEG